MHFEFDAGLTLKGYLNMGEVDISIEQYEMMADEVFPGMIQDMLNGRRSRLHFPPDCTFRLVSIHLSYCLNTVLGEVLTGSSSDE